MKKIFVDASVANKKAAIGIYGLEHNKEIVVFSDYVNTDNSTEGELIAILTAIRMINVCDDKKVHIFCDSKDLVKVINDKKRKASKNKNINSLLKEIDCLLLEDMSILYIVRSDNKIAHKLAYNASTKEIVLNRSKSQENISLFHHYFPKMIKNKKEIKKEINILNELLNNLLHINEKQSKQLRLACEQLNSLKSYITNAGI